MSVIDTLFREPYHSRYKELRASLAEAGICEACARKLAVTQVMSEAAKAAEMRTVVDIQLAEHGVVVVENDRSGPCLWDGR